MATIWKRITNLFGSSKPGDLDYYDEEAEPGGEPATPVAAVSATPEAVETPKSHATTLQTQIETPSEPQPDMVLHKMEVPTMEIPYWLEDEDTLRDEGVLFGLSESEPTEKTEIINNYFAHLAADYERAIEQQNERVQELNLFIGQKENRIEELQFKLKQLEESKPSGEHNLPRTLVGLALSIAMCVGNYYLIEETLRPNFATSSFIALGVFLAGMFNLFGGISLFHDADSNVTRRRLLEEVGMPFAAALFVLAQAWQHQVWWQAVSLFIFVFFLFLFAGKLFLSNITVLRNDLRVWLGVKRERIEATDHSESWEDEITRLRGEIDELRVQKWQVLKQQGEAETECDRLYARRDMLVKLFESEFYLARRMKGRLTDRQLREIRGQ